MQWYVLSSFHKTFVKIYYDFLYIKLDSKQEESFLNTDSNNENDGNFNNFPAFLKLIYFMLFEDSDHELITPDPIDSSQEKTGNFNFIFIQI